MEVNLETRILEPYATKSWNLTRKSQMAKIKSIKSQQRIIQQNANQTHKEIAEQPKSMKPHKEIS
jgi:hypothetical protein